MTRPSNIIPSKIVEAYYQNGVADYSLIPGGEVNITLLVTDNSGKRTILQQLNSIYDASLAKDYEIVAAHLRKEGWEMAALRKAHGGNAYTKDSMKRLWRSLEYIESTPGRDLEGDLGASTDLGSLLGALHRSLATLNYRPSFVRPHTHDTEFQASRLATILPKITDPANRKIAEKMISRCRKEAIDDHHMQLIHGDTRIGNVLIRQGIPFTFIDWDGLRWANPLIDVGDMVQSTVGEVLMKGKHCSVAQLLPMLESYYKEVGFYSDKQTFIEKALSAARSIALDLGLRHLIDSVEDHYFVWDSARFASRLDFNLFCAGRQQQVYEILTG
jgi:Ser/Thr protein kinase RdoA (MazF antagonist)